MQTQSDDSGANQVFYFQQIRVYSSETLSTLTYSRIFGKQLWHDAQSFLVMKS